MKPEKIEEKILELVDAQIGSNKHDPNMLTSNLNGIGFDSLDFLELVMALEEEFEIEIDESHEKKWTTIQDVVDYVVENH